MGRSGGVMEGGGARIGLARVEGMHPAHMGNMVCAPGMIESSRTSMVREPPKPKIGNGSPNPQKGKSQSKRLMPCPNHKPISALP